MGNRISRKKPTQPASTAGPAPSQESVPVTSSALSLDLPQGSLSARKDEGPATKNEAELPLSVREAPLTARDGGNNSKEDPLEFFRRCYALEDDPFTLYTQALLLKNQRQFDAASELLRSLLSTASLTMEARHHLAQCLIAQDPALIWCHEEATQCLEDVVAATKSSSNNADAHYGIMYRESLELLAHVMIAGRRFDRALQLLNDLQIEINNTAVSRSELAAHRQQQTLVSFQRAFCRYARGDPPAAISSELPQKLNQNQEQDQQESEVSDPLEGIELLLHADAVSLREGLALLAST